MPYYCTVPRCTSMAGKAKNVSFHQFPRDEELAKLWNKILKRGKPYTKYSKVCSLHFKPEDYTITSVGKNKGQWRTLRKDAIPSQNLPSESPTPYQRKQWGSWSQSSPTPNVIDTTLQQQMAQAIYMQTMLAMQAAGTMDNNLHGNAPIPQTSNQDILKGKSLNEPSTSYKCNECSKCFKDPDVFILHKRTHLKNDIKQKSEKENLNLTLRANPILANLLNSDSPNLYENNAMENLLMTALAANMEGYLRSFSMVKNFSDVNSDDDEVPLNHNNGNPNNENVQINGKFSSLNPNDSHEIPLNCNNGNPSNDNGSQENSLNHVNGNPSNDNQEIPLNRVNENPSNDYSQEITLNHVNGNPSNDNQEITLNHVNVNPSSDYIQEIPLNRINENPSNDNGVKELNSKCILNQNNYKNQLNDVNNQSQSNDHYNGDSTNGNGFKQNLVNDNDKNNYKNQLNDIKNQDQSDNDHYNGDSTNGNGFKQNLFNDNDHYNDFDGNKNAFNNIKNCDNNESFDSNNLINNNL